MDLHLITNHKTLAQKLYLILFSVPYPATTRLDVTVTATTKLDVTFFFFYENLIQQHNGVDG